MTLQRRLVKKASLIVVNKDEVKPNQSQISRQLATRYDGPDQAERIDDLPCGYRSTEFRDIEAWSEAVTLEEEGK